MTYGKIKRLVDTLLDYHWDKEREDYRRWYEEKEQQDEEYPTGHIFETMCELNNWIENRHKSVKRYAGMAPDINEP